MTVCVYKDGKLSADSLATLGNIKSDGKVVKIGMIYESITTGERSENKDELEYPVEFAMYAVSGSVRYFSRFLRWFISVDHAGIDHNELIDIDDSEVIEDPIEIMVIFKNHNIVRVYDSDYPRDVFVDLPKDNTIHTVGSGGVIAQAILTYDPNADLVEVVRAVTRVDIFCGGEPMLLEFSEDPEYDEEEIQKCSAEHQRQATIELVEELQKQGIDVKVVTNKSEEVEQEEPQTQSNNKSKKFSA